MLIGVITAAVLDPCAFGQQIHPVSAAPQGDLPQSGQVFHSKEWDGCLLLLILPADTAAGYAFQQLRWLDVHQFHLVRLVKHGIRDALLHRNTGNGGNGVVQALDILDIDRGIHVDAGAKQLPNILVALGMAAACGIGVGQLVHQD